MRKAGILLCLLPVPVFAGMDRAPSSVAPSVQGIDLFFGYTFLRSGEAHLNGLDASLTFPLHGHRHVRLTADFSGHTGSFAGADLRQFTLLGGARLEWRGKISPFLVGLAGLSHSTSKVTTFGTSFSSSSTAWGGAVGAGADYRLSRRWAVRGEADLLFLHFSGEWDNDPRLSAGVVYRFRR